MSTVLILEKAVQGMCAKLSHTIRPHKQRDEAILWNRLVGCILSSQVSYAIAQAATPLVTSILFSADGKCELELIDDLTTCLTEPIPVCGKMKRYRFPRLKGKQVAQAWLHFECQEKSLTNLITTKLSEEELRNELIAKVSGIGLKQSSMFLRDVGVANDLAIIDRHVINYMRAVHLTSDLYKPLYNDRYIELEERLRDYATFLGYSLAILDRAIWLVARTAKKERII